MELRGKVAVVTGASSGIGLAIAQAFAAEGMKVVLSDVAAERLDEEVATLAAGGAEVLGVVTDVSDPGAVERLAEEAVDAFGAIHVAVNNAGTLARGYSWELALSEWHRVIDTNLWGVVHGVRSFVPRILATGEAGHVVNVASMAAVTSMSQLGPYTVAKHGVLGLSDDLRDELTELGKPVGVSVVMPGRIRTRLNPIGKIPPEQVALNVVDAIRRNRAYVFTDHDSAAQVAERLGAIVAARADVVEL